MGNFYGEEILNIKGGKGGEKKMPTYVAFQGYGVIVVGV